LRKNLKAVNTQSKDSKNYKFPTDNTNLIEANLTPEDVCLYERMQKSICDLH